MLTHYHRSIMPYGGLKRGDQLNDTLIHIPVQLLIHLVLPVNRDCGRGVHSIRYCIRTDGKLEGWTRNAGEGLMRAHVHG